MEQEYAGLEQLRKEIDRLDGVLLAAWEARTTLAEEIGRVKKAAGLPVEDKGREAQVLRKITETLSRPELTEDAAALYRTIFALSCKRQEEAGGT